MKKHCAVFWVILFIAAIISPVYTQVKYESRNKVDSILITKITPRTLSHLLKPVNLQYNMEAQYELKSEETGRVVIKAYTFSRSGQVNEIKDMEKIYNVSKGKKTIRHVSKPLLIPEDDNETLFVYMITSLVGTGGKELAFSSSKNIVSGTYKIFRSEEPPNGDYIQRLSVDPPVGSDIKTGEYNKFNITLKYSLESKPVAFIDVLFSDLADLGSGRCWKAATAAIPRGKGKVSLKPGFSFPESLGGRNMGIDLYLWLEPLSYSTDSVRITEYFLVR